MPLVPKLSVVVGLISGRKSDVQRCLRALAAQRTGALIEVVVPYDDPCADVATLAPEFPSVRFLRAHGLDSFEARKGVSREHHDALRTIGLRAAQGELVALIEDHAHPAPDWASELVAAFERFPRAGALGGAVDCDARSTLAWAAWFCDFGRYQSPVPERIAEYVSDSNVAYRRAALESVADAWRNDYHETSVHWALRDAGFELWTTPRPVVWQSRNGLRFGAALVERFVWARSFAGTRARLVGSKRWRYALGTPLLPLVMTWRVARVTHERGRVVPQLWRAMPAIALFQCVWALGELAGYVTARPD
jgi:hypothetical protein